VKLRLAFLSAATFCCLILQFGLVNLVIADTVYVVGKSTKQLVSFDSANPTVVTTLSSALVGPSALAMGPDGNLYIGEWGDVDTINPRVSRYDLATGLLSTAVSLNPLTQENPAAIAFRPALQGGEMLIGRLGAGPILKVSDWTTVSPTISSYTTGVALDGGLGLAVAADGSLYVSNTLYGYNATYGIPVASGNIVRFSSSGTYLGAVAADGSSSGGLSGPTGLLLAGSTLYSASVMNGKVFTTNLGTATTSQFATTGNSFEAGPIASLTDGSLLVGSVSGQSNTIYQFSPGGSISGGVTNLAFGQVGGIVTVVPEPSSAVFMATAFIAAMALTGVRKYRRTSRLKI